MRVSTFLECLVDHFWRRPIRKHDDANSNQQKTCYPSSAPIARVKNSVTSNLNGKSSFPQNLPTG